jgi:hypothetical protein
MLTIVLNPDCFHVINGLSNGIKFRPGHYITDAHIPLVEWCKIQAGRTA